ncbi:MAG: hypothetical protein JOZ48_02835 [Acidobacteriaceae bacterium]|nr:hypothetical protein [Acidobacteriaceae bacterium]
MADDDLKRNPPAEVEEREDEREERNAWFMQTRRRDGVPNDLFARASAQKRTMLRQAAVPLRVEADALPGLAPAPVPVYWTPLGPSVVGHGQAQGNPPVSGRINSLAVGPGGTRVYAGAANGGTWYSEDSGASWTPIDEYAFTTTTAPVSKMEADSLSTGAIAVIFGASAATDVIFVGTGEPGAPDGYFGVGIKSATSGGFTPNWQLEGKNLAGMAFYRIAIAPDKPSEVFAATSNGLYVRPTSAPFDNWTQVTTGIPGNVAVTDVVVSITGVAFAAVWGGSVYASIDANNGTGGTWRAIPGFTAGGRVALALSQVPAGGTPPPILYALVADATLHRFDTAQLPNAVASWTVQTVSGVPMALFAGGQGFYDIVLAVDPSDPNTVYMAGDRVFFNDWDLSFFKGAIAGSGSNYTFPSNPANDIPSVPDNATKIPNDATWIGEGIHPDAHCLAFAVNADGTRDPTNVWVGCDGGIFQSTQSGKRATFQSRNVGLAVTELTYIAQHPDTDAVLYGGAQDQGSLRFRGDAVCYEAPEGDGGGVAYDPNNGWQIMRQYIKTTLSSATDGGASAASWKPVTFPGGGPIETSRVAFYGPLAAVAVDATHTLLAFGTNRLWVTPDWGASWTTLPSLSNGKNLAQDVLDDPNPMVPYNGTPASSPTSPVVAIAWASPTRIFVATQHAVWQFDQSGGNWTPNPPAAGLPAAGFPAGAVITAIAVEDATKGTFYVTLGGANVDHVWYFDPTANPQWVTAQLTAATLDIPMHAIVVDPAHTEQIYVGTDVGVIQGIKTGASWNWTGVFNLSAATFPESAVTCVAIHPRTRVLRAATHGLGVWEIPLDVPTASDPDLYLRVNPADAGRVSAGARPAWLDGVNDPTTQGATLTHSMSPDIKALRSSGSTLTTAPDLLAFAGLQNFASNLNTVDTFGTNQLFIEVHNRGHVVSGDQVNVLLLLADGTVPAPALPADFNTRIQNGDKTAWLGATGWFFADGTNPFRTLSGGVEARLPQVVQYNVDISVVPNSPGKIYAAAFVTTGADPLTTANTDVNALVMADKHVAIRTMEVGTDWRVVLGVVLVLVGVAAVIVIAKEA